MAFDPVSIVIQIVIAIVLAALSFVLTPRPKQQPPAAATLDDFSAPTAEDGRPIPRVAGTVLIEGPNVVWYGDLLTEPVRTSGGK